MKYRVVLLEGLSLSEIYNVLGGKSCKCFVVFSYGGLRERYPVPIFTSYEEFESWVCKGKLAKTRNSVNSEDYDITCALCLHIYPR